MRRISAVVARLRTLICLVVLTLMLTSVSPAAGCDCIQVGSQTAKAAAATSDAVFVGEVVDVSFVERHREGNGEIDFSSGTTLHFRVLDMIKPAGGSPDRLEVVTGSGAGDCGLPLPKGAFFLIYAFRSDKGADRLQTNICTRSAPLLCARKDLEELGRRDPPYLKEAMASLEEMGRAPCVKKPKLLSTDNLSWPSAVPGQSSPSPPLVAHLTLTIDVSGDVLDVRIDEVLPDDQFPAFKNDVLQKVKGWKFRPALYRGRAVPVTTHWVLLRPESAMPG